MPEPLKASVGRDVVGRLAARASEVVPAFDRTGFTAEVLADLESCELKERISLIAAALHARLPTAYPRALAAIVAMAEAPDVEGFTAWPLCTFIELYGVDHPTESFAAMEVLTLKMSCEFAIRPFLEHHHGTTMKQLERWVTHPEAPVRRLVSEGTRPRLPWGRRVPELTANPAPRLDLISRLVDDPSDDVRGSVANHLNDVAKDHPALAVATARRWSERGASPQLLEHALRTLVKAGDADALAALGYETDAAISVDRFEVTPALVTRGESIRLEADLRSTTERAQRLVIDFVVHHPTGAGGTSSKVFKWATVDLPPGEAIGLSKRRRIVDGSTRRYATGEHRVELQVAGNLVADAVFSVEV